MAHGVFISYSSKDSGSQCGGDGGIMKLHAYMLAKAASQEEAKLRANPFPAGSHLPCDTPRNTSALDSLAPIDPAEQYRLGGQYESAESCSTAVNWYRKSADQGYAPAQRALADTYAQGMGDQQDMNQAFASYRKAANGGDAEGEYKTGGRWMSTQATRTAPPWRLQWSGIAGPPSRTITPRRCSWGLHSRRGKAWRATTWRRTSG